MKNGILINDVSFSYDHSSSSSIHVNYHIPEGAFLGITGTNGSGKSTFTMLLNGLIPHQLKGNYKGDVFVDGINTKSKPIAFFSSKIGMMFQNPDFMIFNLTVKEEVAFGLRNISESEKEKRINDALSIVGLTGYEERDPHLLSFGQKQKLCLACILAMDTKYIVLDEPIAMLDYASSVKLYDLLKFLNGKGKTIIVVEHDTDFLKKYATRIIIMDKGGIVLTGEPESVFEKKEILKSHGIKIPSGNNG